MRADSSRIRPANDRETSRNDGNGWSIEPQVREGDPGIAAGDEGVPEKHSQGGDTGSNPVGTTSENPQVSAMVPWRAGSLNGYSKPGYPANIPHEVVRSECAK